MESYAVIETGSKQYRVSAGQVIEIEKLDAEAAQEVAFDKVLAFSDGTALKVGAPLIAGAKVVGKVVEQFKGKKLVSFKRKRRKGYRRTMGHRQSLTRVEIISISK